MKNDRYGVKTGVRFAYQSYLKALSENDDSMLRSTCEQNLYWASKDSIDSLRDFDDEFDYELRVLNKKLTAKSKSRFCTLEKLTELSSKDTRIKMWGFKL